MTVVCYEMSDSMSGSVTNDSENGEVREVKRRYVIGQCVGFNDAVSQIEAYAPQYVESDGAGIYWRRERLDVNGIGNKWFDCTATYTTLLPKSEGGEQPSQTDPVPGTIAWDTTGNTEHITSGLTTERSIPSGAPYFYEALNVSGDSVQGIDVVRPSLKYSETWILPVSVAISTTFVGSIYKLTGTVNDSTFRAFEAGECLFMGARAQWSGDQPYVAVTFDFEARPNNPTYYVSGITGISKEGWEHIWIRYEAESSSGTIVRKPIAAYVNTVYPKKDWSGLLIVSKNIGQAKTAQANQAAANAASVQGFFS
jgi:hypothetical protein